jgi:biopolymer transport protein ExbD
MSKSAVSAPPVVLPITPMLDMTFQLMFFFLTTFNPSNAKEGQMSLNLPVGGTPAAPHEQQVDPRAEPHREQVDEKVVVSINLRGQKDPRNRGRLSYLTINIDNAVDEEIKGTVEEREQILAEKLAKVKPADDGKHPPTVRMTADNDIQWSQVMKVMDVCYKTGYQVSFAKLPEG